jgi:hypothetical protein
MAYSDFTLTKVKEELGLTVTEGHHLFDKVTPLEPSDHLKESLKRSEPFVTLVNTEKVRSEFLIAPVLGEVRERAKRSASLFSGTDFTVDPEKGLQGFCDFILSRSPEQVEITAPVVTITEAKNENIQRGLGQCLAEMVAAQIFNQQKGQWVDRIYGAVTTGSLWRFLVLKDNQAWIDQPEYFIGNVDKILAILMLPFEGM